MNYEDLAKTDPHPGPREEHREGTVARSIEQQTAKLPSDLFLWAAFGSIGGSLAFKLSGKDHAALFEPQCCISCRATRHHMIEHTVEEALPRLSPCPAEVLWSD
jgi:hypothetical protein